MKPVIYFGDTTLKTAASYLAGVMADGAIEFDYRASDEAASVDDVSGRSLIIVSDYPSTMMSDDVQQAVVDAVQGGAGLLMIGGWESYCGLDGDWGGTKLAEVLLVEIGGEDDRMNFDQAAVVRKAGEHVVLAGLPWDDRPPVVGGFNRVSAKDGGKVLLEVVRHRVKRDGEGFNFEVMGVDPLLVVGTCGEGRVGALMTDAAPHWVGPLVDWGTHHDDAKQGRVAAQAANANDVEVGGLYARFLQQLLRWVGGLGVVGKE